MTNRLRKGLHSSLLHSVTLSCALLLLSAPVYAQSDALSLSSSSASAGGSVSLNLTLASGSTQPAALQFTLSYSAASLPSFSVAAGAAATAASKSLSCASGSGSYTCVISGMNQTAIGDGTVAVVNATVSAGASGTISIAVTNVMASAPDASSIAASGSGGSIVIGVTTNLSGVSCNPTTVNAPGTSSCTVTLTQAAPGGGAAVTLSSNNGAVSVPTSVTVPAGTTTGSFTASVGSLTTNQTAVVTGTYGVSQTASLTLVAPAVVSSVSCAPTSLVTSGTSSCTVTLSKAAPAGGAGVSLSSNNATLGMPTSVTVAAGATTAPFTATAGSITTNQTAVITAAYNGAAQTASLSLIGPAVLSSVSCTPAILAAGGTSNCTVILSAAAPSGGAGISLSSNNGSLPVPASVTVASGATTAAFTTTAGAFATNQTAAITATYNGGSTIASISLVTSTVVSSLSCIPASLATGASATCSVTLSIAAPAGGAEVSLASNNGLLSVPASVRIVAGAAAATFPATAGSITSNQTAIITATYAGTSLTASISLTAAAPSPAPGGGGGGGQNAIISLSCAPPLVPAGTAATCTIVLSGAAPTSGAIVSVASDNPAMTVPAQVIVPAGSVSGSFTATAAANAAGQTANVSATLNGSQQASLSIGAAAGVSSLICSPASLSSGGTTTCTVTLSGTVPAGGAAVSITSNTTVVTVPTSVTVAAGTNSVSFTATAGTFSTSGQTALITGTWNGSSQSATVPLSNTPAAPGTISSLTCAPDPTAAGTLLCTVALATVAPAGGSNIQLQAASTGVQLPTQVQVPAGAQSVQFRATVLVSDQNQQINIAAALNGASSTLAYSVTGLRPTSLVCPSSVSAGSAVTCVVHLTATNVPAVARLTVSTNSANLKIPGAITTRPRQTRLTFVVQSDALATQQLSSVSVQFGSTTVGSPLAIQQATAPILTVPTEQAVVAGNAINVTVSAADPGGLPVTLSAANLPDGARFDPNAGVLSWTPTGAQQGTYAVTFTATNSASASSTGQVTIHVDSGRPIITDIRNAASQTQPACSSGSVASVTGRWLASVTQPVFDLTGGSTALGGARVLVNGTGVPVLAASSARIDFLCPTFPGGTVLNVIVQSDAGASDPTQTTTDDVSVGVFANDGSGTGQGSVFLAGTSLLATSRTYQNLGQPALLGDAITLRVTGMGNSGTTLPMVKISDLYARADAINPVPGMAGVYDITVTVPPGVPEGAAVPVNVITPLPQSAGTCAPGVLSPGSWPSTSACTSGVHSGNDALSNTVGIAVELGN